MLETTNQPQRKNSKAFKGIDTEYHVINNEGVNNEIKEEIKEYLETNENELITIQNLWDTAKAVLRGKFIGIQAYLKKIEIFRINNLTLYLQELEVQQQRKPRARRRKEVT